MKKILNKFKLSVPATGRNEAYCRNVAISFLTDSDPTVEEIADIKTIVSEAVTNCIVHAYKNTYDIKEKMIHMSGIQYEDNTFRFTIKDKGCGIADIEKAMEPLFTTDSNSERSGMGLPIMKTFSDSFRIRSFPGKGTTVIFTKKVRSNNEYSE